MAVTFGCSTENGFVSPTAPKESAVEGAPLQNVFGLNTLTLCAPVGRRFYKDTDIVRHIK